MKPSDVSAYIVHLVGLSRRKEICDGRSAMKLNGIYSNFEQWRTQNDSRDFPFHSMLQTNHFIYYVGIWVCVRFDVTVHWLCIVRVSFVSSVGVCVYESGGSIEQTYFYQNQNLNP